MPANGKSPNILVIMSDEHGAQFSGTYGHPFISTPHMDRLATEGATFDAAYCNNPLCVPSRISFMTGRFTHNCAGWDNATPLPIDTVTWPYLLQARGYETALSGKMHLIGPDQLHGFQRQLARDLHADLIHPVFRWAEGTPTAREPWQGVVRTGSRVPDHADSVVNDLAMEAQMETGPGTTPEIEADDAAVDRAVSFLEERRAGDAPFALCVGLIAPHFPFVVPEPWFSRYFPDHADLPNLPPGHLESLPPAAQRLSQAFGFRGHSDVQVGRARAAYYGLVSYLDDKIGRLLAMLDATGLADDTVVIHASDHGEMLGEHGLWRKMSFYEQSARIPLQVRWPGRATPGLRASQCVSLVDVTATIVAAADADTDVARLDGHSLLPLLRGGTSGWVDEAFAENTSHGTDRPLAMLRSGHFKLCLSAGEDPEAELYDLVADPGEFRNLAGTPGVVQVERNMTERLRRLWDGAEVDRQVRAAQERRTFLRRAVSPGGRPLF